MLQIIFAFQSSKSCTSITVWGNTFPTVVPSRYYAHGQVHSPIGGRACFLVFWHSTLKYTTTYHRQNQNANATSLIIMQNQSLKNGLSKASCGSIVVAKKAKRQLSISTSDKWQAAAELGSYVDAVKVWQTGQGGIQLAHTGVFIIMHTAKLFSVVSAILSLYNNCLLTRVVGLISKVGVSSGDSGRF